METPRKQITFVLGGAQSGKSYYAQQLASYFARVTFIATGQPRDPEMRRKIARHRRERPVGWRTIEAPLDLCKRIRCESLNADVLLIDCLTLYVSNVIVARRRLKYNPEEYIERVCEAIQASKASVIAVSNEVGSGVVPPYRSGRIFRDFLGQMNSKVAQIADRVVIMIAGLAVTVKDSGIGSGIGGRLTSLDTNELAESRQGVRKGY